MKDVLGYLLSPLPCGLANTNRTLRKIKKEAIARELEKNEFAAELNPICYHHWRDGLDPEAEWKQQDFWTGGRAGLHKYPS